MTVVNAAIEMVRSEHSIEVLEGLPEVSPDHPIWSDNARLAVAQQPDRARRLGSLQVAAGVGRSTTERNLAHPLPRNSGSMGATHLSPRPASRPGQASAPRPHTRNMGSD